MSNPLHGLIPLLAFTLVLDLEFSVGTVTGGGERLAYAADLVDGLLMPVGGQVLAIKISDLFLILAALFVFFGALCRPAALRIGQFAATQFVFLQLFAFTGLVALVLNSSAYTQSQLFVCLSYLAKFIEISLVYVLVYTFARCGGNLRHIFKMLAFATGVAALLGIVNTFSNYFSGWLIQDRIQFYGILTLLNSLWLSAVVLRPSERQDIGIKRPTLIALVVLASSSVLMCGKRTVMLALLVSITYVLLVSVYKRRVIRLVLVGVIGGVAFLPFLTDEIARSFDRPSANIWDGLAPHYADRLQDSWIADLGIGGGLDYSLTERLAKWLMASDIFQRQPFIGGGFWGSQYFYGFIPDSAFFQIGLETGLIGSVFIGIFFFRSWRAAGKQALSSQNPALAVGCKAGIISILVMGIFANSVYVFSLFGVFLILIGLQHAMREAPWSEGAERSILTKVPSRSVMTERGPARGGPA